MDDVHRQLIKALTLYYTSLSDKHLISYRAPITRSCSHPQDIIKPLPPPAPSRGVGGNPGEPPAGGRPPAGVSDTRAQRRPGSASATRPIAASCKPTRLVSTGWCPRLSRADQFRRADPTARCLSRHHCRPGATSSRPSSVSRRST